MRKEGKDAQHSGGQITIGKMGPVHSRIEAGEIECAAESGTLCRALAESRPAVFALDSLLSGKRRSQDTLR
jgi:hypothetical protein